MGSGGRDLKFLPRVIALIFVLLLGNGELGSEAQRLDPREVSALRVIAARLNKNDWDFDVDPCSSGSRSWATPGPEGDIFRNNVTCGDCNRSSICHIVRIELKGQNLTGSLPDEFANLTSLRMLDLTRNYLNGSIPTSWATLPLEQLGLLGNRISGTIPREIGRIITLTSMVIEDNSLGGPIPSELGNLVNLQRFLASANNFTGSLPESLGRLRNLTDFRIDGSSLTGRIPEFIGNWTNLERLDMQGTSLEGPFPLTISQLERLRRLRVSDLGGPSNTFPSLERMSNLIELILRNCSITGPIPVDIGSMRNLKTLDLSFNNLNGNIPTNFEELGSLDYMYLTNNNLTGEIPSWILRSEHNLDISYNTFTGSPSPPTCPEGNLNYVASYSSSDNSSIASCLRRNFPCSRRARNYELFINCGGRSLTSGDRVYEEDSVPRGMAAFYSTENWAYSSTGDFLGNNNALYVVRSTTVINSYDTTELYATARTAPLSLKYYGLCLQEGNYTVGLHFAEIIFTNHSAYTSVGQRRFDVYIQGERVLTDFDIEKEAGGVGIGIVRNFTTLVRSPSHSLEIHLYWAGKGTTAIPDRGVYGPLISAITVTPNFEPDLGDGEGLSVGAIVGIVIASCVLVVLVGVIIWIAFFKKDPKDSELQGLELQTGYFTLRQIKAATKNFDLSNKIGEGGFGPVFKGTLPDGSIIAVKQLSAKSKQGNREFVNEVGMISALQHPNLVKLFGCCVEGNQLLLVYEYMENNSLARALFGRGENRLKLDWPTRRKICIGIARGLAYLHEESRLKIVHRDIKATNVLLDKNLNAKISDFGLAKLNEDEDTHISTRIAGTVGYMAPEYAMRGYLTDKADVYSYGIVLLEIVSGMSNTNYRPKEEFVYLLDWAYVLQEKGTLIELVDTSLGQNYVKEEALKMLNLALICTNPSFTLRPTMSSVVSMLEGQTTVAAPSVMSSSSIDNARFKSLEKFSQDGLSQSISREAPWTDSSVSVKSKDESTITSFHSSTSRLVPEKPNLIDV